MEDVVRRGRIGKLALYVAVSGVRRATRPVDIPACNGTFRAVRPSGTSAVGALSLGKLAKGSRSLQH